MRKVRHHKIISKPQKNKDIFHHLVPRSRRGNRSEFNLFPWLEIPEKAWHELFVNMTVQEVWEHLEEVHRMIFMTNAKSIHCTWLETCQLDVGTEHERRVFFENLQKRISVRESVKKLQDAWVRCFGGRELSCAHSLMLRMILCIMFGNRSEHVRDFSIVVSAQRAWAFRSFSLFFQRQ